MLKGSLDLVITQLAYLDKEIKEKAAKLNAGIMIACEVYGVSEKTILALISHSK